MFRSHGSSRLPRPENKEGIQMLQDGDGVAIGCRNCDRQVCDEKLGAVFS